eukprot:gene26144-11866_t
MRPCALGDSRRAFSGRPCANQLPAGRCIPQWRGPETKQEGCGPISPSRGALPHISPQGLSSKSITRAGAQQKQRGSTGQERWWTGAVGDLMPGQHEPPFLKLARKLAAEKGMEEISHNEVSRVVSFRASPSLGAEWSGRVNVYYTTCTHPLSHALVAAPLSRPTSSLLTSFIPPIVAAYPPEPSMQPNLPST